MIEANDDMANVGKPFRVIACMPCHGRLPLLKHTIERLYKKNGVFKVICAGGTEEEETCLKAGADFILHPNKPLGRKWNAAFQAAEKYMPDACLFVGSSDFISDSWISVLSPYMNDFDLVGLPNCYFADIGSEIRAVHWPGYDNYRKGESIGIGRMISARVLSKINYAPFDPKLDSSLDYSMIGNVNKHGCCKTITADDICSLSISTNKWTNLHKFDQHWFGMLKSEKIKEPIPFLMKHFPEAFQIF